MRCFEHPYVPLFVAFCEQALEKFSAYEQQEADTYEAGGVLIGEMRVRGLTVTSATDPQPTDKRSRFRFSRREFGHQQLVDAAWSESGGTQSYLGEWHSHPEQYPNPSLVDRAGWAARSICANRSLVVVIVGQSELYVGIQERARLVRLVEVPEPKKG